MPCHRSSPASAPAVRPPRVARRGGVDRDTAVWAALTAAAAALALAVGTLGVAHASPPASPGTSFALRQTDPQSDSTKEYRVKAALLFNFIKYTTWPASAFGKPEDPFVILVVGKDPFGAALDSTFEGKKLHDRGFRIERSATLPKTITAHLVFVSNPTKEDAKKLVALSKDKPCLLVGEHTDFAKDGAFVNFYQEGGKVRFEVNTDRKKDTKLELSAELLKLARIVKPVEPEGKR